jgi:hypothetical protein
MILFLFSNPRFVAARVRWRRAVDMAQPVAVCDLSSG